MGFRDEIKKILSNNHGVALMMIMTAIILLMAIYGEFTFESKISRLRTTNILDKSQSKLLAESGLQLALTRLRLYKEAFNMIQTNPGVKGMIKDQLLNQLWEVPFIYPIPISAGANSSIKESVNKFTKETFLEGEMKVNIQNISNRMNLNMLRVKLTDVGGNPDEQINSSSALNLSDDAIMGDLSIDQSLYFLLKRLVDQKREKDESFNDRYSNINYQEMITGLKFFISDFGSLNLDPLAEIAENSFQKIPLSPKYGPMGSSSELYVIPGWNDELIELIQNEFSVYPTAQIDLNKLTSNMLKILIPSMTDEDIKEFFIWRDDPDQPKFINNEEDFKRYIVDQEKLMTENDFYDRMEQFNEIGITFGSNPNLFKVISQGTYNRSTYTLVAYVLLPKQKPNTNPDGTANPNNTPTSGEGISTSSISQTGTNSPSANNSQDQITQLLEPRIIEIQIN